MKCITAQFLTSTPRLTHYPPSFLDFYVFPYLNHLSPCLFSFQLLSVFSSSPCPFFLNLAFSSGTKWRLSISFPVFFYTSHIFPVHLQHFFFHLFVATISLYTVKPNDYINTFNQCHKKIYLGSIQVSLLPV